MSAARLEAMLIAILTEIKMSRSEGELDALSSRLFAMGRARDASDPHSAEVGVQLQAIARFLVEALE